MVRRAVSGHRALGGIPRIVFLRGYQQLPYALPERLARHFVSRFFAIAVVLRLAHLGIIEQLLYVYQGIGRNRKTHLTF